MSSESSGKPSSKSSSAGPVPVIQKVLAALLTLAASVLLLLVLQWLFADFTNLVEQTPRLHEDMAAVMPEGDISSEEFSIVSFGMQQQHFVEGAVAIALLIGLLLLSLSLLQTQLRQKPIFILGGLSLVLLVLLVRMSDLLPLALTLVPIAGALFLATDIMPALAEVTDEPELSEASSVDVDPEGDQAELRDQQTSDDVVVSGIEKGDESAKIDSDSAPVTELEPEPEIPIDEGGDDAFDVPSFDQLTITGMIERPSIFTTETHWDDEDSEPDHAGLGMLVDKSVAELEAAGVPPEQAEDETDDDAEAVSASEASVVEPETAEADDPLSVSSLHAYGIEPLESAEVIEDSVDFEVDGEVVAQIFGNSLNHLPVDDQQAEWDSPQSEEATPLDADQSDVADLETIPFDTLSIEWLDSEVAEIPVDSLKRSGKKDADSDESARALIDEDLLAFTGMFGASESEEESSPRRDDEDGSQQ